jgi:hypothetical protein
MPTFYVSYESTTWVKTKAQSIGGAKRAARRNCPFVGCELQVGVYDKIDDEIVVVAHKNNDPMFPWGNGWIETGALCPQAMWRYK